MIEIIKEELPKSYERAILEEYYNFFSELYGTRGILFNENLRFTTNRSKLRQKDLKNPALMEAIGAYESIKSPGIEFLGYGEDERLSALARVMMNPGSIIQLCDVIFLDYQDEVERMSILKEFIMAMENYGISLECQKSCVEIPKYNGLVELVQSFGYALIDEPAILTNRARTYLLEKSLVPKRDVNEPTRNRKQA